MKLSKLLSVVLLSVVATGVVHGQKQESAKDSVRLDLSYRTVSLDNFNGSAYTVSGEQLRSTATVYLTEALAGLVPGLSLRQTAGGLADGNASYQIRGLRTFNEGVLVLVDGQERAFASLTPEQVESITVLKDAAATGIYGMRAANGAIIVKTRHGIAGKPQIELSVQTLNQAPIGLYEPLSAADYATHYNRALQNDGMAALYSQKEIDLLRSGGDGVKYVDVDWKSKYLRQSVWTQRYNLDLSGGNKAATYYVNLGYIHQPGMFNTDREFDYNTNNYSNRYNFRSNVAVEVSPTTHLTVDLYGWYKQNNMPGQSATSVYNLIMTTPANAFPEWYLGDQKQVDQDGNLIVTEDNKLIAGNNYNSNPWARLNRNGYSRQQDMYGSLRAELNQDLSFVTKGLNAAFMVAMDTETISTITRTISYANYMPSGEESFIKKGTDGSITNTVEGKDNTRRTTITARLGYDRSFGLHNLSTSAFYEQYESASDTGIPTRLQGLYGYASYNYDNRYSVDLTAAYQGWFGFAKNHKFGLFPTVSAGWTVSNEKFMRGARKAISFLKVRASYGTLGSYRGISAFNYLGYMSKENRVFVVGNALGNNLAGYYEGQLANSALTWEKAEQINVGVDMRFASDRLAFTAEWFKDNRSDIYAVNSRISTLMGLNPNVSVSENIGQMNSKGFELAASWSDRIGKFGYTFGGNYAFSNNTVTADGAVEEPYPWLSAVGYYRSRKTGYQVEGIFQTEEQIANHATQSWSTVKPGDLMYRDVNRDGVIDSNDRVTLGYADVPQINYAFNAGLSYGGWSVSVLFQGAARVSRTLSSVDIYPFYDYGTIFDHQTDYWTEDNTDARLPRISTITSGTNNTQTNSLSVVDADYLRLKRAEVAYDFPSKMFSKSFFDGLRVFVAGYNLFTWTDFEYGDPEAASGCSSIPLNRNFSIGCSLKF